MLIIVKYNYRSFTVSPDHLKLIEVLFINKTYNTAMKLIIKNYRTEILK